MGFFCVAPCFVLPRYLPAPARCVPGPYAGAVSHCSQVRSFCILAHFGLEPQETTRKFAVGDSRYLRVHVRRSPRLLRSRLAGEWSEVGAAPCLFPRGF
ncbi:hypothetical protein B0H15DRAFT_841183 [Mycena belliarum]|uniref:Uncharacterized protein n=1 Tax=Mycena belliarum TaxID=1033014 RepID=A0AAD6U7V7_9AGAR|nr:hypothetical protein B0H15DRAFT_841183 [Mycena belliae]